MPERIANLGLRARFILFLGVVLTPLVVLLGASLTSEYTATISAAKSDMRRIAETIAAEHSTAFREVRTFLETVRQLPETTVADSPACRSLLARFKAEHPEFYTIGIMDPGQNIICHSKLQKVQQFGDSAFFARISQPDAADFNISQFGIGKVSKQPTVVAALRLRSVNGVPQGFVFVGMSLTQLLKIDDRDIGEDQTMVLIEMPTARLLARYPALIGPFGTQVQEHPVVQAVKTLEGHTSGTAEGLGLEGRDRLYGYAWIKGVGEAQILAAVGLPRAVALGGLNRRALLEILVCCIVLAISSIGAWRIGYWTQLLPIARLQETAQRIALGDLEARATIERWQAPEFRALGSAFDAMAGKLEEGRKAEKMVADRNRQFEIAERLARVGYWQLDLATMKSTWSDEVFRIYGLPPNTNVPSVEAIVETFHPDDRGIIEEAFEAAISDGKGFEIQLRLHRFDGIRHVLSRGRVERDGEGNVVLVYGALLDMTDVKEAEIEARSFNSMLTMAEEMAEVGHWRFDLARKRLIWSDQTYRIHGLNPATYRPTVESAIQAYHPDDRDDVAEAIATMQNCEFSKRIVRPDGDIRNVVVRVHVEVDPKSGGISAIFGVIMDVTALQQAEGDLKEKSALLKTTLETIDQGLIMVSNDGRLDVSNRRFAELLELPPELLEAPRPDFDDILAFLHGRGEYAASSSDFQTHVLSRGQPFTIGTYERRRPNGRMLEVKTVPLPNGEGIVRTYTDVTHRRNAEMALRDSEARYRMLVENASDMIFRLDRNFERTYVSSASMDILGYHPEELVGRKPVNMVHPDDAEGVLKTYADILSGAERATITNRIRHRDGHWVWVEVELRAVFGDERAGVVGIAGIMRDISDRQAQREQLEAARREAEDALRVKGDFLAVMSHELRTPLNGIIGFANLLSDRAELKEGPAKPYVQNIQTASRHLLSIVNDVLDVSKGEAGALMLDPQPFAFRDFIEDTIAVVSQEAKSKGLAFIVDVDPSIPDRLIGDDARLRQVLVNLLANALKFTAKGYVSITTSLVGIEAEEARIGFRISDTGVGIPKEKLDTLFQRFMQADQTISRRFGGTGLGLSICKDLLALMDSRIEVDSAIGQGTSFEFSILFPVAQASIPMPKPDVAARTSLNGFSILVAEDVPMNQDLLKALLEQWGHTVEIVSDGVGAVGRMAEKPFDLVLMDIHMPVMDGLEATRMIRTMKGPASSTPIIALTANVFPEQVQSFRAAGMDSHVGKPFVADELRRAIETWGSTVADEMPELGAPSERDESRPVLHRETLDDLSAVMGPVVVKGFLDKLVVQLERLSSTPVLDVPKIQDVKNEAHAMLSSAGFLGFQKLSNACAEFENCTPDIAEAQAAYTQMIKARAETLALMREMDVATSEAA